MCARCTATDTGHVSFCLTVDVAVLFSSHPPTPLTGPAIPPVVSCGQLGHPPGSLVEHSQPPPDDGGGTPPKWVTRIASHMDELLDIVDLAVDIGFGGVIVALLTVLGVVAVLVGGGLWLLTDAGLLVLPALLIVGGGVLAVAPGVVLVAAELVG